MSELMGIARFKLHEGKLDEFKRLSAQAMEIVRTKDSGTLQYDTYFNDDESECVVIERYRDSEAAMEHAANLAELSAAILETVSVVHGEVLGEPSAELRAKLGRNGNGARCGPGPVWERTAGCYQRGFHPGTPRPTSGRGGDLPRSSVDLNERRPTR